MTFLDELHAFLLVEHEKKIWSFFILACFSFTFYTTILTLWIIQLICILSVKNSDISFVPVCSNILLQTREIWIVSVFLTCISSVAVVSVAQAAGGQEKGKTVDGFSG